jgi:hypothetical protein
MFSLILIFTQVPTYNNLLVYVRALDIEINTLEEALGTIHEQVYHAYMT